MHTPPVTLTLPFPPRELSPNARVHWAKKQRIVRNYRSTCFLLVCAALGVPGTRKPLTGRVEASVAFVVKVKRKRDEDNLLASIKALWDGLCDAKVLQGDDAEHLHIREWCIEIGEPAVRVVLEAAG